MPEAPTHVPRRLIAMRSPLFRHPSLFLRKVRHRLAPPAPLRFERAPPGCATAAPRGLKERLTQWIAACAPLDSQPVYGTVFGHRFAPDELLRLCRTGPKAGTGLTSDIKLPWEFSRGYDLFVDAARAFPAEELARRVTAWLQASERTDGPAWTCAMEVAIRAVNWICADALLEGGLRKRVGAETWDASLWNHGRAVWHGLEVRLVNSNHYLANLLGLLYLGTACDGVPGASRWREFAVHEMPRALAVQTNEDGGLDEASLPYHALVTEMALLFLLLVPEGELPGLRRRSAAMCQVVADLLDIDGDVVPFGDHDGGRVLALDFVARGKGRGQTVLELARLVHGAPGFAPSATALYPRSGWWAARGPEGFAAMEFGGVGMAGLGAHAHNDALSLCFSWRGQRVLVDPGSYLYSGDPEARNRFRAASVHTTLTIDGRETAPIPRGPDRLFELRGPVAPARIVSSGPRHAEVEAHFGGRPVRRRLELAEKGFTVADHVGGTGRARVEWTFHLAPGATADIDGGTARVRLPDGTTFSLACRTPHPLGMSLREAEYAPSYGQRLPSRVLAVTCEGLTPLDVRFEWSACAT